MQVICATLLTKDEVRIQNIPNILDVNNLITLLEKMGVSTHWNGQGDCSFCAANINLDYLASDEFLEHCSRLRGSVLLIGPLIARFGIATISKPGGDKIGRRRLDTHFYGLQKLGARFFLMKMLAPTILKQPSSRAHICCLTKLQSQAQQTLLWLL